jgi:hypothetical protein
MWCWWKRASGIIIERDLIGRETQIPNCATQYIQPCPECKHLQAKPRDLGCKVEHGDAGCPKVLFISVMKKSSLQRCLFWKQRESFSRYDQLFNEKEH